MGEGPGVIETHISTLFFDGDRVYKRKKPVSNGFVDFVTVESRRVACHREVELNRRLAPDIYLGVADVVMDGLPIEHFVVMKRLADTQRLSALLDTPGAIVRIENIADLIARFHRTARSGPDIDAATDYDAIERLWEDGIAQLAPFVGAVISERDAEHLALLAREYVRGRREMFERRVADGRARDGHGDLQCDDIFCLEDGPRVLDCLEFDDRLRFGDVLNDVAFLAMDLERLGHADLATAFLARYRESTGDHWPCSLEHQYIAYRAHVRSKVACLRHDQGDVNAAEIARDLHALAVAHLEQGRVRLVIVGGAPGTGKSSVARRLANDLGARLLSSDVVRDELFPRQTIGSTVALHGGRYARRNVDAVYDELETRAASALRQGESVVLDASWLDPTKRSRARLLAGRVSAPILELRCVCSVATSEARIRRRLEFANDASEATVEIARGMTAQSAEWPEARDLDTEAPLASAVRRAMDFVVNADRDVGVGSIDA